MVHQFSIGHEGGSWGIDRFKNEEDEGRGKDEYDMGPQDQPKAPDGKVSDLLRDRRLFPAFLIFSSIKKPSIRSF
jgi:hypothetical protein